MVRLERTLDYTVNFSDQPQLGLSVLWWISGAGGLTQCALSTCILIYFQKRGQISRVGRLERFHSVEVLDYRSSILLVRLCKCIPCHAL